VIESLTVLGLITARGPSKGVPRKNLMNLGGRTLIEWTTAAAVRSRFIDRTIISSDDEEILTVARIAGCEVPFVRPAGLAADDTPHSEVISHALAHIDGDYDYLVLLQPTSPLRRTEDIDACIELCHSNGAPAAVSVTKFDKNLQSIMEIDTEGRVKATLNGSSRPIRRQDTDTYILNGAVYVCRCDWWKGNESFLSRQTLAYVMPYERSVDIDSSFDFEIAEMLLSRDMHA
jgi:CMP-N,N'-diacetyllegionaminic acid synthase